jgi:hypothetical protein
LNHKVSGCGLLH